MTNQQPSQNHLSNTNIGKVHTMKDDLANVTPQPFQIRHRRPLPKSDRMEDLRMPKYESDEPIYSSNHPQQKPVNRPLFLPKSKEQSPTNPLIWVAIAILGIILLIILIAIITTA